MTDEAIQEHAEYLKQIARAAGGGDIPVDDEPAPSTVGVSGMPQQQRREADLPQPVPRVIRQSSRLDAMSVAKRLKNWISDDGGGGGVFCECTAHGWLQKKGRRRWFALSGGDLFWFSSRECDVAAKKAKNWLPIDSATVCAPVTDKSFLVRGDGRTYVMSILGDAEGDPKEVVMMWVTAIRGVIAAQRAVGRPSLKKKGFLTLRGKRMFFVLSPKCLSWYKTDTSKKPIGRVPLNRVDLDRKTANSVTIVSKEEGPLDLVMESPKEADEWFSFLAVAFQKDATPTDEAPKTIEAAGIPLSVVVDGQLVPTVGTSLETANDIKKKLAGIVFASTPDATQDTDSFLLRVADLPTNIYVLPEHIPLSQMPFFKLCSRLMTLPILEIVRKSTLREQGVDLRTVADTKEAQQLVSRVMAFEEQRASLLPRQYLQLISAALAKNPPNPELLMSRDALLQLISSMASSIVAASRHDLWPQFLRTLPMPKSLPGTIYVSCVLPKNAGTKVATFNPLVRPSEVRDFFLQKFAIIRAEHGIRPEGFKLKVVGVRSYLEEDVPLFEFDYIRSCLMRNARIELSLVALETRAVDEVQDRFAFALLRCHQPQAVPAHDADPVSTLPQQAFRIRVVEVESVQPDLADLMIDFGKDVIDVSFVVTVELMHGQTLLAPAMSSKTGNFRYVLKGPDDIPKISCVINSWLVFNVNLRNLPRETFVRFVLTGIQNSGVGAGTQFDVGWCNHMLVGADGIMRLEPKSVKLWPGPRPSIVGTTNSNLTAADATTLAIEFERRSREIYFPPAGALTSLVTRVAPDSIAPPLQVTETLKGDKLRPLREDQKKEIYGLRAQLLRYPKFLPAFLLSIDWANPEQASEARTLLFRWAKPPPAVGLELISWRFADETVRNFAVSLLDELSDGDVSNYLLQLVAVVKFEPRHDSALAKFLLRRSLHNQTVVGHRFYWLLKAGMHTAPERLGILLEAFLRGCSVAALQVLLSEEATIKNFGSVASTVQVSRKDRVEVLQYELRKLNFPERFQLPLFSDRECSGLVLSACRHMKSKKLPLWLVFRNADSNGQDTSIIFKRGDDLRQDVLALQLLHTMDTLWIEAEALDLRLLPYRVVVTGPEEGLVEVVLNSETIGGIHRAHGGSTAVFKQDILARWLHEKNPEPEAYNAAVQNFALSCAGYAVATFVLGVGDRHNDNLMIRCDGRLFHIDFGHFCGHFKSKLGIKRERAPFIFTPQMAFVLGGKGSQMYDLFVSSAIRAFLILRRNVDVLLVLLDLMLCAELPEVRAVEDVCFVRDRLHLELTNDEATRFMTQQIEVSLTTVSSQLMDFVHLVAN